jgi:hypothetical protein
MTEGPREAAGGWESDPVAVLERWERAGALWRVLVAGRDQTLVGLFTCDGGEETGRFRCASAALAPLLDARSREDDPSAG